MRIGEKNLKKPNSCVSVRVKASDARSSATESGGGDGVRRAEEVDGAPL